MKGKPGLRVNGRIEKRGELNVTGAGLEPETPGLAIPALVLSELSSPEMVALPKTVN